MKEILKILGTSLGVLFVYHKWIEPKFINKDESNDDKISDSKKTTKTGTKNNLEVVDTEQEEISLPSMWETAPEELLNIPSSTLAKVELQDFNLAVPDPASKQKLSSSPYTSLVKEIYTSSIVRDMRKWNGLRLKFTAVTEQAQTSLNSSLDDFFKRNVN